MSDNQEQNDLFANTLELPQRLMTELDSLKHLLDGEKPALADSFTEEQQTVPPSNSNHLLEFNVEQLDLVELMVDDIVEAELKKLRPLLKVKVMVELKTQLKLS